MDSLKDRLRSVVEGLLEREGFELVDFVVRGNKSSRLLQLFVDSERGVTVDDCVHLSHRISDLLDVKDEESELGAYRLEVSSPGVARPLREEKDFRRNVGRVVLISFLSEGVKRIAEGRILSTDKDSVYLQEERNTVCVPISSIEKAELKVKW